MQGNNNKVYDKHRKDEYKRNIFISDSLPEYFGVVAAQKQRSMMKGRHPNSMKKNDELWHYSRISNERHRLVKSGKNLWNVIEKSAKMHEDIPDVSPKKTQSTEEEEIIKHILELKNRPPPTEDNNSHPGSNSNTPGRPGTAEGFASLFGGNSKVTFGPTSSLAESSMPSLPTPGAPPSSAPHNDDKAKDASPKLKAPSSLKAQLKSAMSNPSDDINLKVDFVNRSLLHYNMTFMIMNYNNEVIYVDRDNLLRVKPLSKVQPNDRVRWKMVDLINPSNPNTIGFSDNVWLQAVDNPDSVVDSTFQTGSVITTKLFTPTDVKGFTFEPLTQTIEGGGTTNTNVVDSLPTTRPNSSRSRHRLVKHRTSVTMRPTNARSHVSHGKSLLSLELSDSSLQVDGSSTAGGNSLFETEDDLSDGSSVDDKYGNSSPTARSKRKQEKEGKHDLHDSNRHNEEYKKRIKICGHVGASRIVDVKKIESLPDNTILSDEKASRYVSRYAMHLGKLSIETAVRMSDSARVKEYFYSDLSRTSKEKKKGKKSSNTSDGGGKDDNTTMNDGTTARDEFDSIGGVTDNVHDLAFELMVNKMVKNTDSTWLKDHIKTHILSLTPIIIQQDQYCLSTATYQEYKQWPLDSSNILQSSHLFTAEQREEYETQYEKFLTAQNQFSLLDSRVNVHSASMMQKFQRKKEREQMLAAAQAQAQQFHHFSSPNVSRPTTPGDHASRPGTANGTGNNKNNNMSNNMDGFCCLRRVVQRNPPYEFIVDQRCVWKICLYEQFSGDSVQTEREKEVKKSMETATMVLKLSKMNREGARIHISGNSLENLPSLASGESFPKRLREITFQLQQKKNEKFLSQRRLKEEFYEEYFNTKINSVLENETTGYRPTSSSMSNSLGSDSFFTLTKPDGSSYAPLFATGESHQYDSEYFQNQDDEEASFAEFSTNSDEHNAPLIKKVRQQSAILFGRASRQSSMIRKSMAMPEGGNIEDVAALFSKPRSSVLVNPQQGTSMPSISTPSQRAKTATPQAHRASLFSVSGDKTTPSQSAPSHNATSLATEISQFAIKRDELPPRPHTSSAATNSNHTKKEYSEDIKKVFDTTIVPPYQKKLLLTNSTAVHEFDHLSNGEQLLSYHKTLAHISRASRRAIEEKLPNFRQRQMNSSIISKLDKLKEEDEAVAKIMKFKDKLRREREIQESGL